MVDLNLISSVESINTVCCILIRLNFPEQIPPVTDARAVCSPVARPGTQESPHLSAQTPVQDKSARENFRGDLLRVLIKMLLLARHGQTLSLSIGLFRGVTEIEIPLNVALKVKSHFWR